MLQTLLADEAGFIVSAELVLVSTMLVIGLIVGLSEVQHAVVTELNDVAEAIGSLNQSYFYSGFLSTKIRRGIKAATPGSFNRDGVDDCDNNECDLTCFGARPEGPKRFGGRGGF